MVEYHECEKCGMVDMLGAYHYCGGKGPAIPLQGPVFHSQEWHRQEELTKLRTALSTANERIKELEEALTTIRDGVYFPAASIADKALSKLGIEALSKGGE